MKTYVLMVSRTFPAYHPRAGQLTYFNEQIFSGCRMSAHAKFSECIIKSGMYHTATPKIHTIRSNYTLWAHRAEEINAGRAVLSLRQWTGSPYNYARDGSKQEEFMQLTKIHVQKVIVNIEKEVYNGKFGKSSITSWGVYVDDKSISEKMIAKNDGLAVDDFCQWFNKGLNEGALIHFNSEFKY
jgi:hypothetical protein